MFDELPQTLILATVGAFLLGWLLSYINSKIGSRYRATRRDARDDRIRSLEAELRIARSDTQDSQGSFEDLENRLKETTVSLERRDNVISEQQSRIEGISQDLRDSVVKTRELRAELTERATENVHAEAKIREVETELSVAQASRDMIATGVLDYDDDAESNDGGEHPEASKAVK